MELDEFGVHRVVDTRRVTFVVGTGAFQCTFLVVVI